MKRLGDRHLWLGVVFAVCVVKASTLWAVPQQMNYQGVLKNSDNQPVTTPVAIIFRFWDHPGPTGGNVLWAETLTVVPDAGGLFNLMLGSVHPITDTVFDPMPPPSLPDRWLGVQVGSDAEMAPRTLLASVGYAHRVGTVNDAAGGDIYGDVTTHSHLRSGDFVGSNGFLEIRNGARNTITAVGDDGADDPEFSLFDNLGNRAVWIQGDEVSNGGGEIRLSADPVGTDPSLQTLLLDGDDFGTGSASIELYDAGFDQVADLRVEIDAVEGLLSDGGAQIKMWDINDSLSFRLRSADGGTMSIYYDGTEQVLLESNDGNGARLDLRDAGGQTTIRLNAQEGAGGSDLSLWSAEGTNRIQLDANYNGLEEGRIVADVLQINGGSDLSEQFEIGCVTGEADVAPGMIVCIDPTRPGHLEVSSKPYDKSVAGVLSGAGGLRTGMVMGQNGSLASGTHPVALAGRVYCFADASGVPIRPGDALTTSERPGYAMKAEDYERSRGAVIGKAMTGLAEGQGLVLLLIRPQ